MTISNVVLIYDATTKQPLRLIVPDYDWQVTAPNGPCALGVNEALLLIPAENYAPGLTYAKLALLIQDNAP